MAQSIVRFSTRRWALCVITLVVAAIALGIYLAHALSIYETEFHTGWILFGCMVFLASYNVRKKLTYPPLFKSSHWLQAHVYVGLFTAVLFLMHTGFKTPSGRFETTLAVLYLLVLVTGLVGLFLTRWVPRRLTVRGQEVIFERIPILRRQLRETAEELVVKSVEASDKTTLADYYRDVLHHYFSGPRYALRHLFQSTRHQVMLQRDLQSLYRYLNDDERAIVGDLADVIRAKDNLDYHHALQGAVKIWLFLHIPLTYMLLMFAVVHVILVYAFSGGAS